jgi:hypothetical protein
VELKVYANDVVDVMLTVIWIKGDAFSYRHEPMLGNQGSWD